MNIQTKFHGELIINRNKIWNFPKGMPGFENENEFVLLPIEGNATFQVLQSTKTPIVAFIVANPYTLVEDYTFNIDEPTINLLEIQNQQDVFVLGILSLKEPFETSTINLQAPLIFQSNTNKAKQMILNDNTFTMRHQISNEITAKKGEA